MINQSFSLLHTNVTHLDFCVGTLGNLISYREENAILKRVSAREENRQGLVHDFLD